MTDSFFQRILVPIADRDDAIATTAALASYLDAANSTVIAVHVIEKAGGAPDKASVEQRQLVAQDIFAVVTDGLADTAATVETQTLYGTDIATTLIETAHDTDTSAIVFTPRGASRWKKLLAGDVTHNLLTSSDVPVITLPQPSDDRHLSSIVERTQSDTPEHS